MVLTRQCKCRAADRLTCILSRYLWWTPLSRFRHRPSSTELSPGSDGVVRVITMPGLNPLCVLTNQVTASTTPGWSFLKRDRYRKEGSKERLSRRAADRNSARPKLQAPPKIPKVSPKLHGIGGLSS